MSTHISANRTSSLTRRAMLKSLAGGTAAAALLATGRLTDASNKARANRESGSAPVLGELRALTDDADTKVGRKRFERRSPD